MTFDEPVLNVLVYASLAAAAAGLGAGGPLLRRLHGADLCIGLAYAIAGGLMLGASHLLVADTLAVSPLWLLAGGVLGVLYTWWVGRFSRPRDDTAQGYRILLQSGLHAAAEGVAIGVAFVLDARLGIFMALVLAVHNVAEAFVMNELLCEQGLTFGNAAALAIAANLGQPLCALAVWALHPLIAPLLPTALGFAAASMIFIVLTELLPAAYGRASRVTIAVATSLGAACVVLLESLLP